ncbi:MAG: hypothetical protein HYU57_09010 [Micavibrio aeruginosavorus]|nr:hypothetical protein [Micavibrio aeruginosavorus]
MNSAKEKNETSRIYLSLLAAAAAPATVISIASSHLGIWIWAFILAFALAAFFGLPLYLLCKRKQWTQWWVSLLLGASIGVFPYAILSLHSLIGSGDRSSTINGKTTHYVINGIPTMAGAIEYIRPLFDVGLLGALGGISAWLVWRYYGFWKK